MRIRPDTPVLLMLAKACNIILLTLVWAVCCAPVVTIGAATTALYTVMWRISAGQDVRVIREFWDAMRTNWKVATASWGIMLLVGLLLAGNMVALSGVQAPPALLTLMKGAAGLVLISYLIVLHYLFAGIAKYYVTISQAFKNAWLWGMASLPRTLVLFCLSAVSVILVYFLEWLSIVLLAYTIYLQAVILNHIFLQYENRKHTEP
ncbi:MAG: hypothetical protein DBY19_02390 [Clostridia bacterium]|nr:MAG: hypothetical protein DBY19_02390 [Clostridia bacterium]